MKQTNGILYTFRTFPYKEILKHEFKELFIFGTLRDDFEKLIKVINKKKPRYIIGVAKSPWEYSQFEREAINQFHGKGKLSNKSRSSFKLYHPQKGYKSIRLSKYPTDSFCNWTMYKIAEHIQGNSIKLLFIHTTEMDINKVIVYIRGLMKQNGL